jgi:hypothetical protein
LKKKILVEGNAWIGAEPKLVDANAWIGAGPGLGI